MMMMMMMMMLFPIEMESAMCNSGDAKPGPPNLSPVVDSFEQTTVQTSEYGKRVLITSREHQVEMNVLHMYGDDPYEWGKAHGELMKKEIQEFIPKVKEYVASEIKNDSKLEWAIELGVDVALDLSYEVTKKYTPSYVMQEIRGISDGSGVHVDDIRRVMWLGELTRGSCSMFGAWGNATRDSRDGKLLQLRALDWDTEGPFRDYHLITVYHPSESSEFNTFANLGFVGWIASITGMNRNGLSVSEIGVSMPDASFGKERYLAPGYPFGFLIRDILQSDRSLDDSINRIENAKRTCDLLLGVGDGNANAFRGFQYAPDVANVFDDENLEPVEDWHQRIDDVVYWGMDWVCPVDNRFLHDQLVKYHGNISAEVTIRNMLSYVGTGDLHIAIYDHFNSLMYVSTAASRNQTGPLEAYRRPFLKLDMGKIWEESI